MSDAVAPAEFSRLFARKVTLNGDILVDPDKDLPIIRSIAQNYYLAIDRALGIHKAYVLSLFGANERISLSKDLLQIAAIVVIGSTVYRPRAGEELENQPNSTPSARREVSRRRRLVHGADAAPRKAP